MPNEIEGMPKKYKLKGFTKEEIRALQDTETEFKAVTKDDIKITEHDVIFLWDGHHVPKFVIVACYDTSGECPFSCENCDRSKKTFEQCFNISLNEARKIINAVPEMSKIYDEIIGHVHHK